MLSVLHVWQSITSIRNGTFFVLEPSRTACKMPRVLATARALNNWVVTSSSELKWMAAFYKGPNTCIDRQMHVGRNLFGPPSVVTAAMISHTLAGNGFAPSISCKHQPLLDLNSALPDLIQSYNALVLRQRELAGPTQGHSPIPNLCWKHNSRLWAPSSSPNQQLRNTTMNALKNNSGEKRNPLEKELCLFSSLKKI